MDREYPKYMYGPGGESRIFERGDVVPKGWKDHPDKVKEPAAPKKDDEINETEPTPEERAAAIAELRAAGAEISDDATDEEINAAIDKLTSQQGS